MPRRHLSVGAVLLGRRYGFALVDLVVTLVLIVTLSGLASLYYVDAQKQRMQGTLANELDELAKACIAWELSHKRPLTYADVEAAMIRRGSPRSPDKQFGNFDFLVEEGRLSETPLDPWKHDYLVDPAQGLVFSGGPDGVREPKPGLTKAYRRESKQGTKGFEVDLQQCRVPPVIAELSPCNTVLKTPRPLIRGLYYANPGCAIDVPRTQLYVDGAVIENAVKSAGQVAYTPSTNLSEDEHTVVLVVTDTAGNQARKQCTFIVHTAQPDIRITKPASGAAVRCQFPIEGLVLDKGVSHWVLNWDFRQIARGEREVGGIKSDGSLDPAPLVSLFDTRDPNQLVEDGRHFITLIEKDRSGLSFTAQTEVVVDNNPPTINLKSKPPARGTGKAGDPFVYTTDVVRISGTARDNIMVRDVRYKFYDRTTGQEVANQPTGGTTAVPEKWDPKDITTTRNWGALYNAPIVEWSTLPSKGTTKEQYEGGFLPFKLQPGLYRMEYWTKDLAGNDSRTRTACEAAQASVTETIFNIDLFKGGIAGGIVIDSAGLKRGAPFTIQDRIMSGEVGPQTSATVLFTPLETTRTPNTTQWEIVIDDNGGTLLHAGDGTFNVTRGDAREDWWATGPLLTATAEIRMHEKIKRTVGVPEASQPTGEESWFAPDTEKNQLRRGLGVTRSSTATDKVPIPQGVYRARISYRNDLGEVRSKIATFVVDKQTPVDGLSVQASIPATARPDKVDEKVIEYRQFNFAQFFPCPDPHLGSGTSNTTPTITAFSQPSPTLGTVEFFGETRDYPREGVIQKVSWSLERTETTTLGEVVRVLKPLEQVFPKLTQQPTNNVSYGYLGARGVQRIVNPVPPPAELNNATMATEPVTEVGTFDGRGYRVSVIVEDGAGLKTTVTRAFTFNSVGPLIRTFTIENARGGPVKILSNSGDLPVVHPIDGQNLKISFAAIDETRIQNVNYRIFREGGGSSFPVRIPDNALDDGQEVFNNFVINRDENNKEFASLPTTYQLQVFASNQSGQDGIVFATTVGFKFLTNVSIYAPHYTRDTARESEFRSLATSNAVWLGFDEQRQIADFLFENIRTAGVKKIFNHQGVVRSSLDGDPDTINTWVQKSTSNRTTDVLVVLDCVPRQVFDNTPDSDLVRFLESKSTDASRAAANGTDGDAMVWVGEIPFAWTIDDTGKRKAPFSANSRNDGHRNAYRIPSSSTDVFYEIVKLDPNPDPSQPYPLYQLLTPILSGATFLPNLPAYDPREDLNKFSGGILLTDRQLSPKKRQVRGATGVDWVLEKLFTVDYAQANNFQSNTLTSGANFVYKNTKSLGTVAHFLSAGPAGPTQELDATTTFFTGGFARRPVPTVGPVIRDYIDRYLLNAIRPEEASRRIYFSATSHAKFGGVGGTQARDLIYWPSASEGFVNLTTNTGVEQDSLLFGAGSNRAAIYTAPSQAQFNTDFAFTRPSIFLFPPGGRTLVQGVNNSTLLDVSLGANGTAVAYATDAPPVPSGAQSIAPAVFFRRVGGAEPLTLTNGTSPTARAALDPDVSANGDFVVFRSQAVYNTTNAPPGFPNLTFTLEPRIYRFTTTRQGNDVYLDGEVSGARLDDVANSVAAASTRPSVSRDGRFVCWQAKNAKLPSAAASNPATQIVLAYAAAPGSADPWVIGAITSDPAGESINADMTPDTVDASFPYIVFESIVDYDNAFPHLVAGAGADVASNRLFEAEGAKSTATPRTHGKRAIYLFAGNFGRPLLRIAHAPLGDFDCLNPKIAADGDEVVFETRAQEVEGFFVNDGTTIIRQKIVNATADVNRVYRVRVRPVTTGRVPPSAILQRITPEEVDTGPRSSPHVVQ